MYIYNRIVVFWLIIVRNSSCFGFATVMSNKNDITGATYHLLVLLDILFGDSDVNECMGHSESAAVISS